MKYGIRTNNFSFVLLSIAFMALAYVPSGHAAGPWNQSYKLLAGDGAADDEFGHSVAVGGTTTVVGAAGDDDNGWDSGSAYLFDTVTGSQTTKLIAPDGAAFDEFGRSVAIDGNVVIVGAGKDDDNGEWSGSAYLFDSTTGTLITKLLPNDGAAYDYFGYSVAIYGTTAIVGAIGDDDNGTDSGSAYLFDTSTGIQIAKLLPDDGSAEDEFGTSVAISGTLAVVGAPLDSNNGTWSGSVYLFDISTGNQIAKLLPNDGASGDFFGQSVGISGLTVIVGAYQDEDNGIFSGSAYLFDTTSGNQIAKLLADDRIDGDNFGWSVAISGATAIVGTPGHRDNGLSSGSAYLFDVSTGSQITELLPSDGAADDYFGQSVSISGSAALAGAQWDNDNGHFSSSAYIFTQGSTDCLTLTVDNLIAGQKAIFTITGGNAGVRAVTVYGTKEGQTIVNDISGYCATFGIKGVSQSRILGGLNRTFDANGEITFNQTIPGSASGTRVFFQSAEQGTCPNECTSNLIDTVVQ